MYLYGIKTICLRVKDEITRVEIEQVVMTHCAAIKREILVLE
jgi:hypothetical protein